MRNLLLLWLLVAGQLFAQQAQTLFSTAGGVLSQQQSYSIGEPIVGAVSNAAWGLSQGFLNSTFLPCAMAKPDITGPLQVCENASSITYRVQAHAGSVYQWTLPDGFTLLSAANGPEIVVQCADFQGGIVRVVEQQGSCISDEAQLSINSVSSSYRVVSKLIPCKNITTTLEVESLKDLPSGIIGMDVCVNYDATKFTPAGTYSIGALVNQGNASWSTASINASVPGKISATIYYTGTGPMTTEFRGKGMIISFDMNIKTNAIQVGEKIQSSICEIVEASYVDVHVVQPCELTEWSVINSSLLTGKVMYRNTATTLNYNTSNPTTFNRTQLSARDAQCLAASSPVLTNATGVFSLELGQHSSVSLFRDTKGSYYQKSDLPSITAVINSADSRMASDIRSGKIANPTIYQLLAADVNMDGRLAPQDMSLIGWRSTLQLAEFPQAWNYNGAVPKNATDLSKDWIFVDDAFIATNTSFSVNNVPTPPACLPVSLPGNTCVSSIASNYRAILLGDVDGNWTNLSGGNLRTLSENGFVLIDLKNQIVQGDSVIVPVSFYAEETLTSLDLVTNYDKSSMQVKNVQSNELAKESAGFQFVWNNYQQERLLLGAFADELPNNAQLVQLVMSSQLPLTRDQFASSEAYLNGNRAKIGFSLEEMNEVSLGDDWMINVSPNPTQGIVSIQVQARNEGVAMLKVLNAMGHLVFTSPCHYNTQMQLSLEQHPAGVYYLQMENAGKTISRKVIKY
ncbi:MAG: T9SS type A sorting domain-containing protein [Cytophagaceae bacterium]|jgi:hypothetical protein|nr:T9SS type A sorting domain-containing protein [Cytophagaceae bacterium]